MKTFLYSYTPAIGYITINERLAQLIRKSILPDDILLEQAAEWLFRRKQFDIALIYCNLINNNQVKLKILDIRASELLKEGKLIYFRNEMERNSPDDLTSILFLHSYCNNPFLNMWTFGCWLKFVRLCVLFQM